MKNIIQIAGIIDQDEAEMLVIEGVDYLGFPLRLPDGREDLSEAQAKKIIASLDTNVTALIITYSGSATEIVAFCLNMGVHVVQLHGTIALSELKGIAALCPGLFVIKSLIVRGNNIHTLERELAAFAPYVDAYITDTFDPSTAKSGATGRVHDWTISRRLVEISQRPVILAGGLTPHNVREAIQTVRPVGVDSHTGVEGCDGRKKLDLVRKFVAEAREGFRLLDQTTV
jgi:phosphoribosylanthranilate isomerase